MCWGRSHCFDPRLCPSHRTKADEEDKEKEVKETPKAAEKKDDDEEDEDVTGELAHLDQSNIIQGGRRTRAWPLLSLPLPFTES